jgi:peptidoglycan hydrolase-like protein with peptidoglycan-binding domain
MLLVVSLGLLSSEQSLSQQQIQRIQRALCSEQTGVLDANTRQALRRYQQAKGLVPSTVLDRPQIVRLLQEPPCRSDRRSYYENSLSREQIAQVQSRLQVTPSGSLEGWTRSALRAFQERQGMALRDGVLTPELRQAVLQLQAEAIPATPSEPLYGLGIPMDQGGKPWVRVNHLSELARYPTGTRLTLTSLGVQRRSIEVKVQGTFREDNPRRIVQISRQAARLLHLEGRKEAAVMIDEVQLP